MTRLLLGYLIVAGTGSAAFLLLVWWINVREGLRTRWRAWRARRRAEREVRRTLAFCRRELEARHRESLRLARSHHHPRP